MSGFSDYAETLMLGALLPNGTDVYLALLTALPTDDVGTGLVECSGSGYARIAHDAWLTTNNTTETYRANNGTVEFSALTGALNGVVGWAVYDAASGGNLLGRGPILDSADNEVTLNFVATDQPRFPDGVFKIGWKEAA